MRLISKLNVICPVSRSMLNVDSVEMPGDFPFLAILIKKKNPIGIIYIVRQNYRPCQCDEWHPNGMTNNKTIL